MQCSAVQCSAVQCSAVQCSAVQCSAVQCSAVQCSAEGSGAERSAAQRSAAEQSRAEQSRAEQSREEQNTQSKPDQYRTDQAMDIGASTKRIRMCKINWDGSSTRTKPISRTHTRRTATYRWVARSVSWPGTGDCLTCRVCRVDTARRGCGTPCGGNPRWSACSCRRSEPRGSAPRWPSCRPGPSRAARAGGSSRAGRSPPAPRAALSPAVRWDAARTTWMSSCGRAWCLFLLRYPYLFRCVGRRLVFTCPLEFRCLNRGDLQTNDTAESAMYDTLWRFSQYQSAY